MCSIEGPPLRVKRPRKMADDQPYPIYLDHNATTPVCDAAWNAIIECRDEEVWGNSSSTHAYGLHSKYYVEQGRKTIADAIGAADASQIIFTSGGTESNNLAIFGTVLPQCRRPHHHPAYRNVIVTSPFEHDAVSHVLDELVRHYGCTVVLLPVNKATGCVDLEQSEGVLRPIIGTVALVTVMHANNELGSIQPIAELKILLARLAQAANVPCPIIHCDAAQSIGKISVDVRQLDVDLLSICSHKFYGPKGVGALYRKSRHVELYPQTFGAGQEAGQRPGTESIILIRGMAAALAEAVGNLEKNAAMFRACRDALFSTMREVASKHSMEVQPHVDLNSCLPNTLSVALYHRPSELYASATRLIDTLGTRITFSAGAACHEANGEEEEKVDVSTSLKALGVNKDKAKGTLRLTTGHLSKLSDMPRAAKLLIRAALSQMPI